jgi:hypothetical protein
VVIDEDLVATPDPGVMTYLSVTGDLRQAKFTTWNPEVTFSEPIREHDDCDQTILLALDEQRFASMPQLA